MTFEPVQHVDDIADCYFYHTMDLPGYGEVTGEWDLRPNIDRYLGNYNFRGKRVLDVGAASGVLSFHMEKMGADIVSYDLSDAYPWDIVPFGGLVDASVDAERRKHMRRINNGYWLAHRVLQSHARVVYGVVYDIPDSIGPVDVAVYGSVLLHLRDPFLALAQGARLAREAVIIADISPFGPLGRFLKRPVFGPLHQRPHEWDSWWVLPPRLIVEYCAILGFRRDVSVTWHRQLFLKKPRWLYTVVAHR